MSILGIDIGTTRIKAIAFRDDGTILASAHEEYGLIYPKPNFVEFDTIPMWNKVFNVIRAINSSPEVKKDAVKAPGKEWFA